MPLIPPLLTLFTSTTDLAMSAASSAKNAEKSPFTKPTPTMIMGLWFGVQSCRRLVTARLKYSFVAAIRLSASCFPGSFMRSSTLMSTPYCLVSATAKPSSSMAMISRGFSVLLARNSLSRRCLGHSFFTMVTGWFKAMLSVWCAPVGIMSGAWIIIP